MHDTIDCLSKAMMKLPSLNGCTAELKSLLSPAQFPQKGCNWIIFLSDQFIMIYFGILRIVALTMCGSFLI